MHKMFFSPQKQTNEKKLAIHITQITKFVPRRAGGLDIIWSSQLFVSKAVSLVELEITIRFGIVWNWKLALVPVANRRQTQTE